MPSMIWKMPDSMSFNDGAAFAVTYGTAYMAMIQRAQCNNKTKVLVTAASGALGG